MDLQVHRAGKWQSSDLNPGQKVTELGFKPRLFPAPKSMRCAVTYSNLWIFFQAHILGVLYSLEWHG